MTYLKITLSVLAAIFFGLALPVMLDLFSASRQMAGTKATGIDVVSLTGLAVRNPLLLLLALALFLGFRAASRLKSRISQAFLFWIPALGGSAVMIVIFSLVVYLRFLWHPPGT